MTIAYDPNTDNGAGFLPLLIRAITHGAAVISAHVHEWPMTVEDARAELDEALSHVRDIEHIDLMSDRAKADLDHWQTALTALRDRMQGLEQADPENTIGTQAPAIVEFMQQTWALGSSLDRDLLGVLPDQTDAGRFA